MSRRGSSDSPAHPLCPAVKIRLEDVVEEVRRSPGWRLPAPPELVRLWGGGGQTLSDFRNVKVAATQWRQRGAELALEGLSGPAKAVTAIKGSMGLRPCRRMAERLSEESGDHRPPMTG